MKTWKTWNIQYAVAMCTILTLENGMTPDLERLQAEIPPVEKHPADQSFQDWNEELLSYFPD